MDGKIYVELVSEIMLNVFIRITLQFFHAV